MRTSKKDRGDKKDNGPLCETCLTSIGESGLKKWEYFWVDRGTYYSLHCAHCVEKYEMAVVQPYRKKPGRKKKEKQS